VTSALIHTHPRQAPTTLPAIQSKDERRVDGPAALADHSGRNQRTYRQIHRVAAGDQEPEGLNE